MLTRWLWINKHRLGLAQVNSEQSDAEADPSIEEGAAVREDSSDDDAADDARYFDARELQRPSRSLSDDLDAAALAADGQANRCACPTGCGLLPAFHLNLLCTVQQEAEVQNGSNRVLLANAVPHQPHPSHVLR